MSQQSKSGQSAVYVPFIRSSATVDESSYGQIPTDSDHEQSAAAHMHDMANITLPQLMTQDQLAEVLQIPVRTIEDWRLRKAGPRFIKVGRRVRYRPADVEAWINEKMDDSNEHSAEDAA